MLKDSIIYFFSKFFPAIISFLILYIYLRYLTPEDYGLFSLIIVSVGLVNILSSQWIRSSYLRYKHSEKNIDMHYSLQFIMILGTLIVVNLILLFIDLQILVKFLINIALILVILNDFYINYFRTDIKPKLVLFGTLLKNLFYVITLIILLIFNNDLNINLALLAYILGLFVSVLFLNKYKTIEKHYKIDEKLLKESLSYGIPITISFALGVLLQNIDKYMITYTLGLNENGNYSMGYDLMHNSFYMIMSALAMASLPRILKYDKGNKINESFNKYIDIFTIITLPILITLLMMSEELSNIFKMHDYMIEQLVIIFVIIATLFHGLKTFIYDQAMQLLEKTAFIFIPSLIAVIINIIINAFFLEKHGIIIAAISSVFAFIISAIVTGIYLNKYIKIKFNVVLLIINFILLMIFYLVDFRLAFENIYINFIIKSIIIFSISLFINFLYYYLKARSYGNEQ